MEGKVVITLHILRDSFQEVIHISLSYTDYVNTSSMHHIPGIVIHTCRQLTIPLSIFPSHVYNYVNAYCIHYIIVISACGLLYAAHSPPLSLCYYCFKYCFSAAIIVGVYILLSSTHTHTHAGPPNQPNIMIIGGVPNIGSQLPITWETGDEDGAHPFVCHFGIITERSNDLEKEISFDFDLCNMDPPSTSKQFNFQNFDPIKTYTVVVCSKNLLGHNCSDPVVVYEPVLSPGPGSVLYKEPTLSPGIIAVIVIVVLIVVSCCLVLVLLLIFCLCCKETLYKNYRPEKRGKYASAHTIQCCVYKSFVYLYTFNTIVAPVFHE